MSKTTKIIAALGVVAGLGVAALPAFTFATGPSTTGNVEVDVEVEAAIAMTIVGNNDDGSLYNGGVAFTYTEVQNPTGNPSENKYYELIEGNYVLSEDDEVDENDTYYTRSSNYASVDNSAPTGVAVVDGHTAATISGTSSSYTKLLPNAASDDSTFKSTIKVYTNATSGYTLTLNDQDTNTSLVKGDNEATIPAVGTVSGNQVVAGTAAWGYKVGDGAAWLAVPDSEAEGATIKTRGTATEGGEETTVYYGVSTASDQATGVYKDTIVYTATVN